MRQKVVENLICKNCVHFSGIDQPTDTVGWCTDRGSNVRARMPFCSSFECGDWSDIVREPRLLVDDGETYHVSSHQRRL